MQINRKELAKLLGVSRITIEKYVKDLGLLGKEELTDEDIYKIQEAINDVKGATASANDKVNNLKKANKKLKINVRRIDEDNSSSIMEVLQDCKERYVKNEELIQRLQFEIDQQDVLMNGNSNGTVSSMPQLATMERYIKINIALRNQILDIEKLIGRSVESEESDPFN